MNRLEIANGRNKSEEDTLMKDTKVIARPQISVDGKVDAATEISRAGMYTVGIVSALVGIWGLACFVGGLVASGGPLSFVANWFKAVAGI